MSLINPSLNTLSPNTFLNVDTLFIDIGGVLLTNGWDHPIRKKAADHFALEWDEFEKRHRITSPLFEVGRLSLDTYLQETIFWKKRAFSVSEFIDFMQAQSLPLMDMIDYIKSLKKEYHLKIAAVSNEGRELALFRAQTFDLASFIDVFYMSCFLGYQKPDPAIYKMALDISNVKTNQVIYLDDRQDLIDAARYLNICGICHHSLQETKDQLESLFTKKS